MKALYTRISKTIQPLKLNHMGLYDLNMLRNNMKMKILLKYLRNRSSRNVLNLLYCTTLGYFVYKSYTHTKGYYCIEDEVIRKAKNQIDQSIYKMKQEFGTQMMSFPEVAYHVKGGRYSIEFLIDQRKCDLFSVLASFLQTYEPHKEATGMNIKNFTSFKQDNIITLQLEFEEFIGDPKKRLLSKGTVYITGENTLDRPNFRFILEKTNDLTQYDIEAFASCYKEANRPNNYVLGKKHQSLTGIFPNPIKGSTAPNSTKTRMDAIDKLEKLGVTIFLPEANKTGLDWDYLAGYEKQKRDIEDTVLLSLTFPEIYDDISKGTRMKPEPNRPKAVLFEGPPGTGKTTSAKIIAQQVNIPLIYMPIESIMSKYYGESEKRFAEIFDGAKNLGKAIIFIDEIDAIASSRENSDLHEASKRILSTLLRKIDSFESSTDVLLVCATNRKQDLDSAMLSRIDLSVKFELPDKHSRIAIFQRYAKHLDKHELKILAEKSEHMSGRNISDICKDAERRWASKLIRKEVTEKLPVLDEYLKALESRISQNLA